MISNLFSSILKYLPEWALPGKCLYQVAGPGMESRQFIKYLLSTKSVPETLLGMVDIALVKT